MSDFINELNTIKKGLEMKGVHPSTSMRAQKVRQLMRELIESLIEENQKLNKRIDELESILKAHESKRHPEESIRR